METYNWVNIGSRNGLVPDGTKPLPEPMLTYQMCSVALIWEQFHTAHECVIHTICLEIALLKLLHFPGDNESMCNAVRC